MSIVVQIIGFVGLAFAVTSFQVNTKKKIIFFQILCGFAFTVHFLLLGAYTGAVLNALSALRSIVFYHKGKRWASSLAWPVLFAVCFLVTGIFTWEGMVTVLPVIACLIHTVFLYADNPKTVRRYIWISSPCWIVYNVLKGSYGGILTETFNLVSIFTAIYRYDIRGRKKTDTALES